VIAFISRECDKLVGVIPSSWNIARWLLQMMKDVPVDAGYMNHRSNAIVIVHNGVEQEVEPLHLCLMCIACMFIGRFAFIL
jgi:hypothetical protein